jgi:hypothetical protein
MTTGAAISAEGDGRKIRFGRWPCLGLGGCHQRAGVVVERKARSRARRLAEGHLTLLSAEPVPSLETAGFAPRACMALRA